MTNKELRQSFQNRLKRELGCMSEIYKSTDKIILHHVILLKSEGINKISNIVPLKIKG